MWKKKKNPQHAKFNRKYLIFRKVCGTVTYKLHEPNTVAHNENNTENSPNEQWRKINLDRYRCSKLLNPNIYLFLKKYQIQWLHLTCNSINPTQKPTEHINAYQKTQIFSLESGVNLEVIVTSVINPNYISLNNKERNNFLK